jgi:hypothetical protein
MWVILAVAVVHILELVSLVSVMDIPVNVTRILGVVGCVDTKSESLKNKYSSYKELKVWDIMYMSLADCSYK